MSAKSAVSMRHKIKSQERMRQKLWPTAERTTLAIGAAP